MKNICKVVDGLKAAIILMVVVQLFYVGINILYKLVVYEGMNLGVIIAYRFVFATAFMAPLAFIFERKKRPKMTWTILFQGLICGLFGGTLAQTLYLEMLALTTVTFASALNNLLPAATFVMAIFFGLEKLNWKSAAGKAKTMGTIAGISGAMLLTFYKGPPIPTPSFHVSILHLHHSHVASSHSTSGGNTLLGALCGMGSISSISLWLNVQSKMSERYPCHYTSTTLMSLSASVFSIAFALCTERDWAQWKLGWNIRLLTVAYAGLVASGVNVVVMAWSVRKGGPLFVSVFTPLQLLFLAFLGSFFMDETLHLGSIIGGVLIVSGLYMVLWGKAKEMKKMNWLVPSQTLHVSSSHSLEIIVKSSIHDPKSSGNNNININAYSSLDKDHQEDSSENGNQEIQDVKRTSNIIE
ncbi:WAT1-related protein At1g68170-like [Prosopis cineraria]|uniref:WAT1-related protein At1g68170-like n=1 Tax=Prosopis cineraria TaxID=364024 RepID=UPI00240F1A95|nr:WAT1-related protein At1g68170-like [Prosopis cineraria]